MIAGPRVSESAVDSDIDRAGEGGSIGRRAGRADDRGVQVLSSVSADLLFFVKDSYTPSRCCVH